MTGFRWMLCAAVLFCCGCRTSGMARIDREPASLPVGAPLAKAVDGDKRDTGDSSDEPEIELVSVVVTDGEDDLRIEEQKSLSLTLTHSISMSLAQNPDLIAIRQTENVSAAALGVAETYPFNPFLQVQATPYQVDPAGGANTTYHYVLLMQTIQLAHQQQFREEGAASALNSTRWNIHQAELLNVAQTERLYFNVLYLRGILELANASDRNNQELLQILEKQLDAGQATAADVAIVRVDARSTHQQFRLAKANYETALRDLKRQLGVSPDDFTTLTGDLRSFVWQMPSLAALKTNDDNSPETLRWKSDEALGVMASWAAARPDVMAAHSDIDVARAGLCLATASRTPDLQVGPYYQRTMDGTYFLGFRAQMDLPVLNSGKPLERQRAAEHNQRIAAWQQALRRAELEAQAAWERYKMAYVAVTEEAAYEMADLPTELQSLEQQFLEGEVDVVRVVQARTSMIQNQRIRLDLLNELAQSAANLTGATGIPLEDLLRPIQSMVQ